MTDKEIAIVRERLRNYRTGNPEAERQMLVECWRKHHPEAATEKSETLQPLVLFHTRTPEEHPHAPDEIWVNEKYSVTLRRHANDKVFASRGGILQLGIASADGTARHDWRDFQAIKNQLAGARTEAFELYPSEQRLLDPSNYYTLWCFPGLHRIRVGVEIREVRDADLAFAPQRAFPTAEPEEA